jgi:cytochrome d ubiquinol oxidase subunit II
VNGTSIAVGVVAVVSTIYIAAVWLAGDAARLGRADLVEAYRTRAIATAVVAGVVSFAALIVVRSDSARLWHGLTTWPGAAAVAVSALAGATALALVATRRLEYARVVSAVAVAAIIAGWALAQRPDLLPGLTIDDAAAGRTTIVAVLVGLAVGSLILIPSLALLFRMVLLGTFDTPATAGALSHPGPDEGIASGTNRSTALCVVGLAAGALVLVVGDAAWSLAIGAGLLLVAGAFGFAVVARSLASSES